MKHTRSRSILATSVALALGLPAAASAQQAGDDRAVGLEEIIVTARRVEESIQEVPISMTVYDQAHLTSLNIVTAVDLATFTPSLAANPSFGSENASLSIRGFKQDIDTAPAVGTYFADVVVPRGATQGTGSRDVILPGSMFDLQNVQVLKGPQGTLFGRNTTGGAVLLVPQKPGGDLGGYVEGSAGNYDMVRMQGMVNAPLGDATRLRIAADSQQRDGYLENIAPSGSSDFEDMDYQALRASLVVDVTDDIENYTIASGYKSETNSSVQKLIACNPTGYDPVNIATGLPNFIGGLSCGQLAGEKAQGADFHDVQTPLTGISRIEQWQVINTTTWDVSETLTVKNIASYAEYQNTQRTPMFGTNWQVETLPAPYPALFFRDVPAVFVGIGAAPGQMSADQSTYTEELQFQGSLLEERMTYQAGAYFEWSDPESGVGNQTPTLLLCDDLASLDCIDPLGSAFTALAGRQINIGQVTSAVAETSFRNRGLYAQSTYNFTEKLRLTGGVRYTWDKQTTDVSSATTYFDVTPPYTDDPRTGCTNVSTEPSCAQHLNTKSDEPTWLIGLDYFPVDDVMAYGKYARGYRSGGIVTRAPFDYRVFDAEELDNYEVGVKTGFDGAVSGTLNIAGFYNELTNQQIQASFIARVDEQGNSSGAAPTTGIVNAGESRVYGAEVEASLVPLEGLVFNLSYTWLDTEIRKIDDIETQDPLYQSNISVKPGAPLWQTPEHRYTLGARYTLPLDPGLGRMTAGLTYVYIDEQLTTYVYENPDILAIYGENLGELASVDLLSANVDWENIAGLPVDVSLFVTNLTDEEYYGYVAGLASSGLDTAVLGQPRMYGMRLRYRFGGE